MRTAHETTQSATLPPRESCISFFKEARLSPNTCKTFPKKCRMKKFPAYHKKRNSRTTDSQAIPFFRTFAHIFQSRKPMNRLLLLLIFSLTTLLTAWAGTPAPDSTGHYIPHPAFIEQPKIEARTVWLTTLYGLDWPKTQATDPASTRLQQEELCRMLDQLKEAGINCVFFQSRMRNDVAYRSQIEPLSPIFTGKAGQDPGYDPLAFCIQECHKRGMECHAWLVTLPLGTAQEQKALGKRALSRAKSPFVVKAEGRYYLDPGYPETADYLARIVAEITDRYDIDGIQFDYFRYPENLSFPDQKSYHKYGTGTPKSQWREENLTVLLRRLHQTIKSIKPWVKISICPLGKYDQLPRYDAGGFTAKRHHQDAKRWLSEGLLDWVCPMLYYRDNHFFPFLTDWLETEANRPVIPGLGIYFLDPSEGNWGIRDVMKQICFGRNAGCAGIGYYRAEFLIRNLQGLKERVEREFNLYPSLLPPMQWASATRPTAPGNLQVEYEGQHTLISWEAPVLDSIPSPAPTYNLYASDTWPVDITRAENLVEVRIEEQQYEYDATRLPARRYFAVTTYDRYNQESDALQMPAPLKWNDKP